MCAQLATVYGINPVANHFIYIGLDFLGTIRLVNYIRSEVKNGNTKPDVSSAALFEDEKYLKPVLEDDALLYSLDDIADLTVGEQEGTDKPEKMTDSARIKELENELSNLRGEFAEYKQLVQKALNQSIEDEGDSSSNKGDPSSSRSFQEAEKGYFTSYAYNGAYT